MARNDEDDGVEVAGVGAGTSGGGNASVPTEATCARTLARSVVHPACPPTRPCALGRLPEIVPVLVGVAAAAVEHGNGGCGSATVRAVKPPSEDGPDWVQWLQQVLRTHPLPETQLYCTAPVRMAMAPSPELDPGTVA